MAKNNRDKPRTLEIQKYQNRGYYGTTCSRHLSLQQIQKLIKAGSSIRCFPDFPNPFSTPIRMPEIS
jgi:polyhydroxyalkanoate synthesis regulator protein